MERQGDEGSGDAGAARRWSMSDEQKPVAWAAVWPDGGVDCNWIYDSKEDAEWAASGGDHIDGRRGVGTVVPLYREPKPALTDEEREAVIWAAAIEPEPNGRWTAKEEKAWNHRSATLRGLLERLEVGPSDERPTRNRTRTGRE